MTTMPWYYQHTLNHRALKAMKRNQDWVSFMLRLNLSWYEHWRTSLSDEPVSPYYDPLKPYLYDWGYHGR